jgi:hypothetical protein
MPTAVTVLPSLLLTWYAAAVLGSVLIWLVDWCERHGPAFRREVRRVAAGYRKLYGARAAAAAREHYVGAAMWARRRDRDLLEAVAALLARKP